MNDQKTTEVVDAEIIDSGEKAIVITEDKPMVVSGTLMPTTGLTPVKPKWMPVEQSDEIAVQVNAFLEKIKINPTDIDIQTSLYKLGDDGSKEMMPQCALFDTKMTQVMKLQKEGDPITNGLLGIKKALDMINPTILAQVTITEKVAIFFSKSRLPKADEIADMIYERRETVQSTVDGIKRGLLESADMLIEDLEEIKQIYEGMVKAQILVERDIYWAQLLHSQLLPYSQSVSDQFERQALEDNLAVLTQVVNALQSEEAANMVFFANAQNYAKQNNLQLFNIKRRIPLLEKAVLANLGLKAGMARLQDTMRVTDALTDVVGDTLADAASAGRQMGLQMTQARGKALINIEKLGEAINDIDLMYEEQGEANKKVIALGMETSKQLSGILNRIRDRVEGGHESMVKKQ
jgi:hypothetical protein